MKLENYFFDDTFMLKLNKNPYLLGFNNGVYNLELMEFKTGNPLDFISLSVGYDYVNNSFINELDEIIKQIIPNENIKKYVLKLLGYCLFGKNELNNIFVFSEYSANLMRFFINLIEKTFGDYYLLFQNNNVEKLKDKRFTNLSNNEEELNVYNINNYTKLLTNILELDSNKQTKIFLLCNKLPLIDITNNDLKVWKKIKNIPLRSNKISTERILELKKT